MPFVWTDIGLGGVSNPTPINAMGHEVERLGSGSSRAIITRTTTLSIASGSVTPITFTTEEVDVGGLVTVPSTTLTLNASGFWLLVGGLVWAANATGARACLIEVNGVGNYQDGSTSLPAVASAADVCRMGASVMRVCSAGDTIDLGAFQSSGAGLNINSARLAAYLLAPS